jgi:hypothetical protein
LKISHNLKGAQAPFFTPTQDHTMIKIRLKSAFRAALIHFFSSVLVAALVASLVFGIWFPYPYSEFAGGKNLFLLIIAVDIVCGPLLTMVVFTPSKPKSELVRDLGLIVMIQLGALGYGIHTVWAARPLFLVHEVERFKVITAPNIDENAFNHLEKWLMPKLLEGPKIVSIRSPKDTKEKNDVIFSVLNGGRDYAERPDFYIPYEGEAKKKSIERAHLLTAFLKKYPEHQLEVEDIAQKTKIKLDDLLYVPVIARQDWIAVLNKNGDIVAFLKGDGF